MARQPLTAADVITGELAQNGNWVVACVDPQFAWPTTTQKLIYRNVTVFVLPQFDDYYPSIAVKLGGTITTFEQAQVLILNLLSALSWVEDRGALVEQWTGGNLPRPMAGFSRSGVRIMITDHFAHHYLPDVADAQARWALAFYREGMALHLPSYGFLSFYKIINIFQANGPNQKAWINANIDAAVQRHRLGGAGERLQQLRAAGTNIGDYLYESGRCAVAHAGHGPTVDPESPADIKRLAQDMPLIKALAAFAIEDHFHIKSISTIYQEHLYELAGFQAIFGEDLTRRLKAKEVVAPAELPAIPALTIGLFGEQVYPPLANLQSTVTAVSDGVVLIQCQSADGLTRMMIALDFPEERLHTNVFQGMLSLDNGAPEAVSNAISVMQFQRKYFGNGTLIVKRTDTDAVLGRCDPFIPTNVDMGGTLRNFDATIQQLRNLLAERAAPPPANPQIQNEP